MEYIVHGSKIGLYCKKFTDFGSFETYNVSTNVAMVMNYIHSLVLYRP